MNKPVEYHYYDIVGIKQKYRFIQNVVISSIYLDCLVMAEILVLYRNR